jgi:hypothetical protein
MLNADSLDRQTLENTLTVLLKHESDVQKAKRTMLGGKPHPLERDNRDPRQGRSGSRRWSEWNN